MLANDLMVSREEAEARTHFADEGALGLPPLLERKRLAHGIPNSAFKAYPIFDQVLVWQVPIEESNTWGNTGLIKAETTLKRELTEAPRGVIVAAGLTALDQLRSHGVDVGHTIFFYQIAPLRMRLPTIAGKEPSLVMITANYVFASEELSAALKTRECRVIARENAEGVMEHFFCDANGKTWKPAEAATKDG